jgi:hypothetical protein
MLIPQMILGRSRALLLECAVADGLVTPEIAVRSTLHTLYLFHLCASFVQKLTPTYPKRLRPLLLGPQFQHLLKLPYPRVSKNLRILLANPDFGSNRLMVKV